MNRLKNEKSQDEWFLKLRNFPRNWTSTSCYNLQQYRKGLLLGMMSQTD